MATSRWDGSGHEDELRPWPEDDIWVANNIELGVMTQGLSWTTAVENPHKVVPFIRREWALTDGQET